MSYWTELFVGDADAIGRKLQCEESPEPNVVLQGILPEGDEFGNTLQVFTEAACKAMGRPFVRFLECIGRRVAGDEDEDQVTASFGANVMTREWVQLIGGMTTQQRELAARQWVKEWDPGAEPSSAEAAARDLVDSICRGCEQAIAEQKDLVCAWTL